MLPGVSSDDKDFPKTEKPSDQVHEPTNHRYESFADVLSNSTEETLASPATGSCPKSQLPPAHLENGDVPNIVDSPNITTVITEPTTANTRSIETDTSPQRTTFFAKFDITMTYSNARVRCEQPEQERVFIPIDFEFDEIMDSVLKPNLNSIKIRDVQLPTDKAKKLFVYKLLSYATKNLNLESIDGLNRISEIFPEEFVEKLKQVLSRNQHFVSKSLLWVGNCSALFIGLIFGFMITPKDINEYIRFFGGLLITLGLTGLITGLYLFRENKKKQAFDHYFGIDLDAAYHDVEQGERSSLLAAQQLERAQQLPSARDDMLSIVPLTISLETNPITPDINDADMCIRDLIQQTIRNINDTEELEAIKIGATCDTKVNIFMPWYQAARNKPLGYYFGNGFPADDKSAQDLIDECDTKLASLSIN